MSVKEREPEIVTPVEPEKKAAKPLRYQVVMEMPGNFLVQCNTCILTEAFGMSASKARGHIVEAQSLGSSIVLPPTTREIAEAKAEQANELRDQKGMLCNPYVRGTKFTVDLV